MRLLLLPLVLVASACRSPAPHTARGPAADPAPLSLIAVAPPEPAVARPWAVRDGTPDRFMPLTDLGGPVRRSRSAKFAPLPSPVAPRRR